MVQGFGHSIEFSEVWLFLLAKIPSIFDVFKTREIADLARVAQHDFNQRHPERSEGSRKAREMFRFAQHDVEREMFRVAQHDINGETLRFAQHDVKGGGVI